MNESEIRGALTKYKFYHIIKVTENVATPGNPRHVPAQNLCLKVLQSIDLKDKRVLDIGCRDGLFSFAAERMGAAEVIGIDNDISIAATEFLIPFFKSKVRMEEMNLYDLKPDNFGLFDLVIFPGVLYHLRYPFWGLKAIRDVLKPGGTLITETAIYEGQRNRALMYCPIGDDSPYEMTSCTMFNEKGLRDTLTSLGFTTLSIEYCRLPPFSGLLRFLKRLGGVVSVSRCVFNSRFSGFDKTLFVNQYWEGTHDFHTQYGSRDYLPGNLRDSRRTGR